MATIQQCRSPLLGAGSSAAFIYGHAPNPVRCGRNLEIGAGTVIPEINFTLPPIELTPTTWPEVRAQYIDMIEGVCRRALELQVPGLLVEFESLPHMTVNPKWGSEIVGLLRERLERAYQTHGLKNALRFTPSETRDHERTPRMRGGPFWEAMRESFRTAAQSGADLLAIESTGGKEISDHALMNGDLRGLVFALGVLAARDMEFLWGEIVDSCASGSILPAGDSACGFGNTAMVLAEQKIIPRVLAAIVRVATVPRSLVAYEMGAIGPSKNCACEGPYLKAIAGIPISMEGRSAACAHLSPVGNIAQAVCDCWSNGSPQNVRLLSTIAPVVSMEQLAYDCRLLNTAAAKSRREAVCLRDWLVDSDCYLDPQAYVLRPDVVLRLSRRMMSENTTCGRTRVAALAAAQELKSALEDGLLHLPERELRWLDKLLAEAERLPQSEQALIDEFMDSPEAGKIRPEEYGLAR